MCRSFLVIIVTFIGFLAVPSMLHAQHYVKISGKVVSDDSLRRPVSKALVEIIGGPSIRTDENGDFELIIDVTGLDNIKLHVTPEGNDFSPYDMVLPAKENRGIEIRLVRKSSVSIKITEIQKNSLMKGVVTGLESKEIESYKVLVFVFTDRWYLHPYASNVSGKGYADIAKDGTWRIQTIWRGFPAEKVAALLVNHDYRSLPKMPYDQLYTIPYRAIYEEEGNGRL